MNLEVEEEWRPVVGFEGLYWVSSLGRVKNKKGLVLVVALAKKKKDGYCCVNLSQKGKQKDFPIHRLVAKAFIPNPFNLPTVNHKNLVKTDNYVENLEWMSFRDNTIHALKARGKYKDIRGLIERRRLNFKPKQFYIYDYRNVLIAIFNDFKLVAKFCNLNIATAYRYLNDGSFCQKGYKMSLIDIEPEYHI